MPFESLTKRQHWQPELGKKLCRGGFAAKGDERTRKADQILAEIESQQSRSEGTERRLSPHELKVWLSSHEKDITDLALSQPVLAVRYDLDYARQCIADFSAMHGIGYDQNDCSSQRCVTMAALDFVLSPLKSRRLKGFLQI
jgi:hypothetical protein